MPGPKAQAGDYTGTPTVDPSMVATPSIHENAPIEAFGGATAKATEGLGASIEKAGDELFARAYAMQDLNNHAEAQQADADYMSKAGELHANFTSLKGRNAQDAYPQYKQDLGDLRTNIGNTLSNPMSRKLYDSSSLGTMGRTIFNGAGHAGDEAKRYQLSTNAAAHKAIMDQVTSFPDDPSAFNDGIQRAKQLAIASSGILGNSPDDDATKLAVKQAESDIWSSKITGMMRKDPDGAKKLMEVALDKGWITGQDYQKMQNPVDTMLHSVVSRNVSDAVQRGWAPYTTPEQQMRSEGVEQSLVDTIKLAQRNHPELQFGIGAQGGRRTQGEQNKLFAQGRTAPGPVVTWTQMSEHMTGRAADVVPYSKGTNPDAIRAAMQEAAGQLGVKLADTPELIAKGDTAHYQLAKDFNIGEYKPADPPTLDEKEKLARDFVHDKYNDPKMDYATTDRVRSDHDKEQTDQKHQNQQDYLTLANFSHDNNLTNKDAILNTPYLAAVYNRMDAPAQIRIDKLIAANAKAPTLETPEKAIAAQKILNMFTEAGGKREAAMKIDPAELLDKGVVSTNGMKSIYAKQRQVLEGVAKDDYRLTHALSISRNYLKGAGILSGSDEESQFMGSMNQWLSDPKDKDKPRTDKEIMDKANDLISTSPGAHWWSSSRYNFDPPADFTAEVTDAYQKKWGRKPQPGELARMFEYSRTHEDWRTGLK